MVPIHMNHTIVCRRATHRVPSLSKALSPAEQALAAINSLCVPWTYSQPARTHVPGRTVEKNLRLPSRTIHRDNLPRPDAIIDTEPPTIPRTPNADPPTALQSP
eukprot:4186167-Pleurochrysis_carterae.AAC.1